MSSTNHSAEFEKMAKQHGMTTEEFASKSGLKINTDGSHSLQGHSHEMFTKEYSEAEIKELAEHHKMSEKDMQKHIVMMRAHAH